jgi:hypothetical protein
MKQEPKSDRAEVYRKVFYELLPLPVVEVWFRNFPFYICE